eukprot:XP_001699570.1 predicted protein [Chlamydomonas reinhardtii]
MLGSPYQDLPATSFEDERPTTPPQAALSQVEEDPILRRTPSPRVSQHPSVAALYQYAQEVCTPVSCNSKPVRSGTPPDCAELVSALEGAAHGVDTDATGGELCGSFGSWLAGMGLDAGLLSASALAKMQLLWEKAKEAMQLQAVVEQLKEAELQLAQQEAEDNARHVDILLAENENLLGTKAQLQEQLAVAEQRLAHLAAAAPVPTPHVQIAPADDPCPGAALAAAAESPAKAHSWAYGEHREASSVSVGQWPPAFGAMESPSTAAFAPAASPQALHSPSGGAVPATSGAASGAAGGFSISLGSLAHPSPGVASPTAQALPVPQSPSDSVNGPAAPAGAAATPGLSFTSAVSQLPFGTWGAGGGFGGDDFGAVPSPSCSVGFGGFGSVGGFGGAPQIPSPNEAQSAAAQEPMPEAQAADPRQAPSSWPLSPGGAVSTYSAQTEQVQPGAADEATSRASASAQPTPVSSAAPQLSAGLSTVSRQHPPAFGYESWRALQEAQTPEAAGLLPSSLAASPASVQAPAAEALPSPQGFAALQPQLVPTGAMSSPHASGLQSLQPSAAPPSPQPAGAMPSPHASGLQSPQASAGLSVVSHSPAPVPFGAWSSAQQGDGQDAQSLGGGFDLGAATHSQPTLPASPGSFVSSPAIPSSPAVASPLLSPVPDTLLHTASASATTAGAAAGKDSPSAAAQLRSNPLFEYEMESPAPHTPLPTRSDGLLGPMPAPETSPEPAFPSLASTPMTQVSAAGRTPGDAAESTAEPMDYSPAPAHMPFGLEAVMESPIAASGFGSPGPFGEGFGASFGGPFGGGFAADGFDDLGDMPSPPAVSALSLPAHGTAAGQAFSGMPFDACVPVEHAAAAAEAGPAGAQTADAGAPSAAEAAESTDAVVTGAGKAFHGVQVEADGYSMPAAEGPVEAPVAVPAADAVNELAEGDVASAVQQRKPVPGGVSQPVRYEATDEVGDLLQQPEVEHTCANDPYAEEAIGDTGAETEPAAAHCFPDPASPIAASYLGLGDVGSPPCAGAVLSPVGSVQANAQSLAQPPAAVTPAHAAEAEPPVAEVATVAEASPVRPAAACPAPVLDQEEPATSSPAAEQQARDAAAAAPAAEVMSPVPAAGPSFEAPASGASSAVKPSTPGGGEGCPDADGGAHSYPNTPSGAWPASPTSTMYATPLEAFATPHSLASFYTAAHMTALRMLSAVQTPATGNNGGLAMLGIPTPVASFSFGMMGPAGGAPGAAAAAATPALARGFPVMVGGDPATPGFGFGDVSPAEAQAQPFAGAGGDSFGSPLPLMALTPVQMRTLDDLASRVLAAMSPSLLARVETCAELGEDEAKASTTSSPEEASRAGEQQEQQHASPAATTLSAPAAASPIAFGSFAQLLSQLHSPLPVAHRRDALANAVTHGGASGGAAAAAESDAASPPAAAIAAPAFLVPGSPAAFNFAQLVAQLHSPMPLAHMPRRAAPSNAAAAPAEASTPSPPAASGPSQASAAVPTDPAAFDLAAMLAHLQSPLPQPVAARRMAAERAAEGAAAAAVAPVAAAAAAAPEAAPAVPGSPAAFNFAQLLTQLHSPLPMPMHRLSRSSAAASQPISAPAVPQPQEPLSKEEQATKKEQKEAAEAAGAAPDAAAASPGANEPVTVADAMPNFAKLMAFLNGNGRQPASPAPARATARAVGDSNAGAQDNAVHDAAPSAPAPMDGAGAAAAMFNFASLIAHLHSPMPNGAALALVPNPGAFAASQGQAPGPSVPADSPGAGLEADSPAAMAGGAMSHGGAAQQDSPANSEAASFGFSTAAKLSTRVTPSTTPGAGNASLMRWAKETAPPTFRLDSDRPGGNGRSRLSRTPPTPVSFSFGAPGAVDDGATPAAHGGFRGSWGAAAAEADAGAGAAGEMVLAQPAEQQTPSSADTAPRSPVMSLGFNFHAAADGTQSPAYIFGNAAAAAAAASPHSSMFMLAAGGPPGGVAAGAMPHSPMFMMAAPGGGAGGPMPHSPMFMIAAAGHPAMAPASNAPHSPAFSFGHAAEGSCPITPGFGFADAAAAAATVAATSPQSPAFAFGANGTDSTAAPHSSAFSFGNHLVAAEPGAAAGTPVAFLGGRPYMLAHAASTPTTARGVAGGQSAGTPGADAAAAGAVPPSPTPSLGFWMMVPRGGSAVPGSPAPTDLSFAFGDMGSAGCVVGTPIMGGMVPGAEHASPVLPAAWQQLVGASPIWGLAPAAHSDDADTPDAAAWVPSAAAAAGAPAFWSSLLGSLHSPMPMMLNPRRGASQQQPAAAPAAVQPQAQLRFEEQQSEEQHSAAAVASMDPPSLDMLPMAAGGSAATTGAVHGAATQASGATAACAAPAAATFSFTSAAAPEQQQLQQPALLQQEQAQEGQARAAAGKVEAEEGRAGVAAGQVEAEEEEEEDQDTPREAVLPPPSYEDLPELIAAGLCMSVSATMAPPPPVLPPPAESPAASALDACSSVGENPTPFSQRLDGIAAADVAVSRPALLAATTAGAPAAIAAAAPDGKAGYGGLLFTPVRRVTADAANLSPGDGAAAAAAPVLETLAVQSVSDSSRSGLDAQVSTAGMEAGRTTDDAAATPSRLLTAASGCARAEEDTPSVHSSPVFSFGQPPSSAGEPSICAGSAAAPPRLTVAQDRHDLTSLSSPPPPGDATTPVSLRSRGFAAGGGSGSPGLHVVMSPAAALLRRAAAAGQDGEEEAVVVVEMPDVRDSIRGFVSSANSTPQQPPPSTGAGAAARDRADRAGNPFLFASTGASLSATGQQQQQNSSASASAGASINFSADAVQRLLFDAADAVADSAATQPAADTPSAESSSYSCDSDIAAPPEEDDAGTGASGATPHMTYTVTAAPGSPVLSSRPSVYAGLPTPGCLTPFSYMGPNSLPATPLTAELASAAKGGAAAAAAAAAGSASASKAIGGGAGAARHHPQPFWAPNASGPVGGCMPSTNGERVTLEVLNRRICANADLLLDFQGSPGRQSMPGTSASGATPPRARTSAGGGMPQHRGPAALFISPSRKSSDGGATAAAAGRSILTGAAAAPAPAAPAAAPAPARTTVATITAATAQADAAAAGAAAAASRTRLFLSGAGVPVQQLVAASLGSTLAASGAAAASGAMNAAAAAHLPLSQRLGLWHAATLPPPYGVAAWGVPLAWPGMPAFGMQPAAANGIAAYPAPRGSGGGAAPVQQQQQPRAQAEPAVGQPQPQARPPPAPVAPAAAPLSQIPAKPAVTSRDVQTTPSLAAKPNAAGAAAKPAFRSRIPTPGSSASSAAAGVAANARAIHSTATSGTSLTPAQPAGPTSRTAAVAAAAAAAMVTPVMPPRPAQSPSPGGASSDDESSLLMSSPVERVVRRRRLLTSAAAAGGPQRVPVAAKRPAAGPPGARRLPGGGGGGGGGGRMIGGIDEDEVRRRAMVLGMRISPYLRPKKK